MLATNSRRDAALRNRRPALRGRLRFGNGARVYDLEAGDCLRLPEAAELHYRVQRGDRVGSAQLQWQPGDAGYRLRLDTRWPGQAGSITSSATRSRRRTFCHASSSTARSTSFQV